MCAYIFGIYVLCGIHFVFGRVNVDVTLNWFALICVMWAISMNVNFYGNEIDRDTLCFRVPSIYLITIISSSFFHFCTSIKCFILYFNFCCGFFFSQIICHRFRLLLTVALIKSRHVWCRSSINSWFIRVLNFAFCVLISSNWTNTVEKLNASQMA